MMTKVQLIVRHLSAIRLAHSMEMFITSITNIATENNLAFNCVAQLFSRLYDAGVIKDPGFAAEHQASPFSYRRAEERSDVCFHEQRELLGAYTVGENIPRAYCNVNLQAAEETVFGSKVDQLLQKDSEGGIFVTTLSSYRDLLVESGNAIEMLRTAVEGALSPEHTKSVIEKKATLEKEQNVGVKDPDYNIPEESDYGVRPKKEGPRRLERMALAETMGLWEELMRH